MGLFNFLSRKPAGRRTYDDIFLELREEVTERRLADTEMLDAIQDDAKTHFTILFAEARACMITDPARAQQLMRLALVQGSTLEAVAQERYQTATVSLEKSFKAIAKTSMRALKALPAAASAPKVVEGADVRGVPQAKGVSVNESMPKSRITDDNFDSDYMPSRNGKQ